MTHYEERLEKDLRQIRDRVRLVAQRISAALRAAVHALLTSDREAANRVILGDLPINREIRAIDKLCHAFVARHLPSAGHLRFVSSVLRLNVELERIGDYAVAIARETVQLSSAPNGSVQTDIAMIADQAFRIFDQAMQSFNEGNAELARGTKGMSAQIESTYQKVFSDLLAEGERGTRPVRDLFALLVVINRLSRVSDQSKNICEDTVFSVSGETKAEKIYRVLFIDERNDTLSQLAEVYARKVFPHSGDFSSAGWSPSDRLLPALETFMEANGLDGQDQQPKPLDFTPEELADFHVIVALQPGAREHISRVPFRTVLTHWDLGAIPADVDPERIAEHLGEAYKRLTPRVRELMETLRGEEAD